MRLHPKLLIDPPLLAGNEIIMDANGGRCYRSLVDLPMFPIGSIVLCRYYCGLLELLIPNVAIGRFYPHTPQFYRQFFTACHNKAVITNKSFTIHLVSYFITNAAYNPYIFQLYYTIHI